MQKYVMRTGLFAILILSCFQSVAKTITIIDEQGKPVENAVVIYPTSKQSEPVPSEAAVVDQIDKAFVPLVLTIRAGRQVVFPNSDNIRHHVYSFSEPKPFELKLYAGNSAPPVSFDVPGVVVLGCNIHDAMIGYIYVYDENAVALTKPDGKVELMDDVTEIRIWHPQLALDHTIHAERKLASSGNDETVQITLSGVVTEPPKTFGRRKIGTK